jgi:hypothetical protein
LTASFRLSTVELEVESPFTGEELVRMKVWVATDPVQVIEVVDRYGRVKVLDDREHVVKGDRTEDFQNLQNGLREAFREEVEAERIVKETVA